jgi:hypothetical protein
VARQCHDVDVLAGSPPQRRKTHDDFKDCVAGGYPGWVKSDFVTSSSQSEQVAAPHSLGAPFRRLLPRQSLQTGQRSESLHRESRSSRLSLMDGQASAGSIPRRRIDSSMIGRTLAGQGWARRSGDFNCSRPSPVELALPRRLRLCFLVRLFLVFDACPTGRGAISTRLRGASRVRP